MKIIFEIPKTEHSNFKTIPSEIKFIFAFIANYCKWVNIIFQLVTFGRKKTGKITWTRKKRKF